MVTDFLTLLGLCDDELRQREYKNDHYERLKAGWNELAEWMQRHNYTEFNRVIGYAYCDETFGSHLLQDGVSWSIRIKLRSVRMLISFQKDGDFEFRTPKVEHDFTDPIGILVLDYIKFCENALQLSAKTVKSKELYLYEFSHYLRIMQYSLNYLTTDIIENFFRYKEYTLASRHNAGRNIRLFLRFAFDTGNTEKDLSVYVLQDNYRKQRKLPTTYEESEIRKIIASVERSAAVGKRDYLILLLAAEYGWRSSDITHFCFDDIDWDNNVIRFRQHKTGNPVEYPLLASVGNAVTKYMRKADIQNWENKKHGAHSLRHSLATNMLKKNISLPVISTVMGHQNTAATKIYLSVDTEKLRQCVLPIPPIYSAYYRKGAES